MIYRFKSLAIVSLAWSTLSPQCPAQDVPAVDPASAPSPASTPDRVPPPVNLLSGKDAPPAAGDAGHIVYTFGTSLPSIVCAPLHVCDIELQPGETVNDINAGDPV